MPYTRRIRLLALVILINVFIDSFGTLLLPATSTAIIRAISLTGIIFYYFLNGVKLNSIGKLVLFILLYFLVLMFFSSAIDKSFWRYSKFALSILFLPISYSVVKKYYHLKLINTSMIIAAIFIVVNVVFSTVFGIESSGYQDDSAFSTGNMFSGGLFTGVYFVILSPFILKNHSIFSRRIIIVLILAIIVINILVMKRSTIFILVAGVLVYSILNRQVLNKYIVLFGLSLSITFLLFGEMFMTRLEYREEKMQVDSYENEARYLETLMILKNISSFEDPIYSFFGKELFNTVGNYGDGAFGSREIHNDYMVLLSGSGIFGLFLYLLLYYKLFMRFIKVYKTDKKLYRELYVFYILVMMTSLLISFNGGMASIGYRSIGFIYMGAILGIIENNANEVRQKRLRHQVV